MGNQTSTEGWKKFRYCPAIDGVPRNKWTEQGYQQNNCFSVIGRLQIPFGTRVKPMNDRLSIAEEMVLDQGSLIQTDGKTFDKPLSDDNGAVSSLYNREYEYKQGELAKLRSFEKFGEMSAGLYFYMHKTDAQSHPDGYLNSEDETVRGSS